MGSKIFDYDNPFFQLMSRVWDLMMLNFIAALLCIPVVTSGASLTALYYVTLKMAEERDSHIYRSFFKAFKDNFAQSLGITAALGIFGGLLLLDAWYFILQGEDFPVASFFHPGVSNIFIVAFMLALLLAYAMTSIYVFAVQARFTNPVLRTLANAFMMSVRHLPSTVAMLAVNAAFIYITVNYVSWLSFWLLSGPAYMNSLFLSRIFKRYMEKTRKEIAETDKNTED